MRDFHHREEPGPDHFQFDPERILLTTTPGASITRRPFTYATSFRMEELDVISPGGAVLTFVAKYLGRRALTGQARKAKSPDLASTCRELIVYRRLLAGSGLGTPELVGGGCDEDGGVLVLERVGGSPLSEIGDFGAWTATAGWMARMHARLGAATKRLHGHSQLECLLRYDETLLEHLGRRGLHRLDELGLGSDDDRAAIALLLDQALISFRRSSATLVHGDLYPSNVLVEGSRIAVVDWELAGMGPPLRDLAALVSGGWSDEQRRSLAHAYLRHAAMFGPVDRFETLLADLDLAILHLALSWLGSDPDWIPPVEHRRDWFAEAVSVVRRRRAAA